MSPVLSEAPLSLDEIVSSVVSPERGGVAVFLGFVRDHHAGRSVVGLDYEAYGPMAESECETIVREAEARWPVRVAVRHRVGRLAVGETAVVVAAAGAHRTEAFDACRHVIEELKRRVPIWKRERYADGTEAWVDPTAPGETVPAATRQAR